jgi:hypothetical protein
MPARFPKGHRTATAGAGPQDTTRTPQGAPWAPAADALDGARSRLLWALALLLPYALAGLAVGLCVTVGATRLIEPHAPAVGAAWGLGAALALWLGRLPRVALAVVALAAVALATS